MFGLFLTIHGKYHIRSSPDGYHVFVVAVGTISCYSNFRIFFFFVSWGTYAVFRNCAMVRMSYDQVQMQQLWKLRYPKLQ